MNKKLLFVLLFLPLSFAGFSQYNFSAGFPVVYSILHSNSCSNSGCHSAGSSSAFLRFDTTSSVVFGELFNQPPMNTASLARGEQLVWMDQPYQSYLLKKAGYWFDTDLGLPADEGDSAHSQAVTGLTKIQVEYIRQWIMDSAAQFTNDIDTAVITAYYNGDTTFSGPFSPKLAKPAAGTGIQLRDGPFFIRNTPGQNQVEYLLMNQVNFPSNQEATAMDLEMISFSHHFILFTFDDSASAMTMATGLREVQLSVGNTVSPFDGNKTVCSAWSYTQNVNLPTGTAFFWPQKTYLDLDYHMLNYSTYNILPFDMYLNIATKTRVAGDGVIQMKARIENNSTLGTFDQNPPNYLNALPPHTVSRCIDEDQDNLSGNGGLAGNDSMRYIWLMNSHTHKMGSGFNIYNFDNTKTDDLGRDTVYNGFIYYNNPTGAINQGYYDWEHPPVETFPNLLAINYKTSGLIAETMYTNDSSFYQRFGFTTNEEMQLFYYLYVTEVPAGLTPVNVNALGVNNLTTTGFDFNVYPNPMAGKGTVAYTLDAPATVNASITDITGNEVAVLKDDKEQSGTYNVDVPKSLSAGLYFAKVTVNGEAHTKKFVVE